MNVGHGTTATVDGGVSSKQLKPSQVLLHHGVDQLTSAGVSDGPAAGSLIWRVQQSRAAAQHSSQLLHSSAVSVEQILETADELLTSGTIVYAMTTITRCHAIAKTTARCAQYMSALKMVCKHKSSRRLRKNLHITILSLFGGEIIFEVFQQM